MKDIINPIRLLFKTLVFALVISLILVPAISSSVGKLSIYNWLVPGRDRLPFSDTPKKAYNLSLFNLDAMFASHQVSGVKEPADAYRVFILGDSSTWGTLLKPEETLAGQLNFLELTGPEGRPLQFYNLGYPTLSLTKDLLLLQESLAYDPDMIIWLFTLESFPADKQLTSPLVENNPHAVSRLFQVSGLDLSSYRKDFPMTTYWDSTLFGQRRNLADILRLQLYGVMWGVTGIDQYYPEGYIEAARDLTDELDFHEWQKGEMPINQLALEILTAGEKAAVGVPMIFVNEPILISQGVNSEQRYNFYYPRWAYDEYREALDLFSSDQDLIYLDYWNLVPPEEFTNTAIHTTPQGVRLLSGELVPHIQAHLVP
ncbi:MAG: hypothetical protein DRI65_03615 [Chloroflexota bacterium]|nr:MAG: hypothetical protein DRI65_03615 [Chloroflexota bacterium]